MTDTVPDGGPTNPLLADYWQFTLAQDAQVIEGFSGRARLAPNLWARTLCFDIAQLGGAGAGV